jgi:hypothetical protein
MTTGDTPEAALTAIQSAMDNLNNAIDDTHPEGCECDICHAADALDAILMMQPPPAIPAGLFPEMAPVPPYTHDTPEAALLCSATRSTQVFGLMWCGLFAGHDPRPHEWFPDDRPHPALDGQWVLVRDSEYRAHFMEERAEQDAEIARLRAALRQIAVWPGDRKLVASICEIALTPAPSEP